MAEVVFGPPEQAPRPRSGTAALLRRFWFWAKAWVLWYPTPTAGEYADAVARLEVSETEMLRLKVELAAARAELEAAKREVGFLSLVCTRAEEWVAAGRALAAAERERAVNSAADARGRRSAE